MCVIVMMRGFQVRGICVKNMNCSSRVLREQLCGFVALREFLQDMFIFAVFLMFFSGHPNRSRFSHKIHTRVHAHRSSFSHKIHTLNLRRRRPIFTQAWAGRAPAPDPPASHPHGPTNRVSELLVVQPHYILRHLSVCFTTTCF